MQVAIRSGLLNYSRKDPFVWGLLGKKKNNNTQGIYSRAVRLFMTKKHNLSDFIENPT
jgi:hypothetical protein